MIRSFACAVFALGACETVTVQGVEITPERQVAGLFGALAAGAAIAVLADDDTPRGVRTNPGFITCKADLATQGCVE
ncbi:MAG: hypothetical protein AAGK02_08080 [Pseudomonadota bacterium]